MSGGTEIGVLGRALMSAAEPTAHDCLISATDVLRVGHGLEMCGIHAARFSTEVIQNHPLGDLSDEVLIRESVSSYVFDLGASISPEHELAIAIPI